MGKKTFLRLFAGYCATVAVALTLLRVSISHRWIDFAPHDRAAGPILLSIAAIVGVLMIFVAIGIGLYVYRDARRRGMEPLLWTLMAVFVPYLLGLIIYLIARHPLLAACSSCGARIPEKASFCPSCGRPLARSCARCQASLQNGARFCHACGQEVAGA
jgi:hypothetical protein